MSDLNTSNTKRLKGPEQTRQEYAGFQGPPSIGVEVEYQFTNRKTLNAPLNIADNARLEAAAKQQGVDISHEASAQTVEIKTEPYRFSDVAALTEEFNAKAGALKQAATLCGFDMHEQARIEGLPYHDLLSNIHPRERAQVFLNYFDAHKPELAEYFTSTSGVQISISYAHEADGFKIFRRGVYSVVLLAALLDNDRVRPVEGTAPSPLHLRLSAFGLDDAIPNAFWQSQGKAEQFFDQVNEDVWDHPLFCAYDQDGVLQPIGAYNKGAVTQKFCDLPEALKTRVNYDLAVSTQWHLVSLSLLPYADDFGYARRVELRCFDSLPSQYIDALSHFYALLETDASFAKSFDTLCARFGLPEKPDEITKTQWTSYLKVMLGQAESPEALQKHNAFIHDFSKVLAPYLNAVPALQPLYDLARKQPYRPLKVLGGMRL